MGPTVLLPLRRKALWGFFSPEKSDGFGRVWTRELGYQRPARLPLLLLLLLLFTTSWSRVLLERLIHVDDQVVKFPAFYGTRRFITAFTWAHCATCPFLESQISISHAPHTISWRSIVTSIYACLPDYLFPSSTSTITTYVPLLFPI